MCKKLFYTISFILLMGSAGSAFAAGGLTGKYYNNMSLIEPPVMTRFEAVNFDWGAGSPQPGVVNADGFSVRWTGSVTPRYSEPYRFSTRSDDGVRLWVNNQLIINNWTDHSSTIDTSSPINLKAGKEYAIKMEFYENGGDAVAELYWDSTTQAREIIPAGYLTPTFVQLKAYNPTPEDGAQNQPKSVLYWGAGETAAAHDVYFGTDATAVANAEPFSPEYIEQTIETFCWLVSDLQGPSTTYYWRIDEIESDYTTIHKGDIWTFSTAPLKAHSPIPADGALWQDPNVALTWGPGFTARYHELYFGTDRTAVENANTSTPGIYKGRKTSGYKPGPLAMDTNYYWRVDEVETVQTKKYKGDIWQFKTIGTGGGLRGEYFDWSGSVPPPRAVAFANRVLTRIDPQVNFTWGNGSPDPAVPVDTFSARWTGELQAVFTETYTFTCLVDDGFRLWVNDVLVIDSWIDQGAAEHSGTIALVGGQQYPIQVEYYENGGGATAVLYWSGPRTPREIIPQGAFSPPLRATAPNPADGATDVKQRPTLSWMPGMKTLKHDVYLGEDENAVANANTSTAGIYKGQFDVNEYIVTTDLKLGQTYYWRVDEVNNLNPNSPWKGWVWSFTVVNYLFVDDFESYTNTSPNIIWQTWIAGGGGKAGYNDPNYAEVTAVHGGRQSMPFDYGNLNPPNYSEATRTFTAPQDWVTQGTKALSLWLRGYAPPVGSFVQSPAGTYTMTAGGTDINDVPDLRHPSFYHDEFHYAYTQVSGNCLIIAKVESVSNTDAWAKAGVMVRDSLDANSIHAMMCMTPGNGAAFQYRDVTGGHSTTTNQTGITTPYWVAIERQGDTFYGVYCADGVSWAPLGQMTITMPDPVYIGLCLTARNTAATCTAVFTNVSINQAPPPQFAHQDISIKSNIAAPLYVTLQDSSQNTAKVTNADPNIVLSTTWQAWDIPLSSFAGVYKNAITKLTIGVGTRSVSTGTIYIDDIRLYLPRCLPDIARPAGDLNDDCLVDYLDIDILTNNWLISTYDVIPGNPGDANLMAYYQFEGNLLDSSSKGNHGDPCGAPTYTAGRPGLGQALNLRPADGNDWVETHKTATQIGIGGGTARTTAAWVYTRSFNDGGIWEAGAHVNGQDWSLRTLATLNQWRVQRYGYPTYDFDVTYPSQNKWVHFALVYDGTAAGNESRLYADGYLIGSQTIPLNTANTPKTFRIGVWGRIDATTGNFFDGLIDELRVYNRALTQDEVAYLAGKTTPYIQPIEQFLTPQNPNINAYNDKIIDLKDYTVLADMWLEELLWPQ
jgi:hypothetical protein